MSLIDRILLRLGLVRLNRYGLAVGPDGRLVSGPELAGETWSDQYLPPAPVVDLLHPDPAPRRLARGSNPPPIPGSPGEKSTGVGHGPRALTVISLAPMQAPLAAPVTPAPEKPIPANLFDGDETVDDELTVRPDATPLSVSPPPSITESHQWATALSRAKSTSEPADDIGAPDADEEWEWKLAMARAKAEPTRDMEAPGQLAEGSGPTPMVSKSDAAKKPSRSKKAMSYLERKVAKSKGPLPSLSKRRGR